MNLRHYAAEPVVLDRGRTYQQASVPYGKPAGLWVSVPGEDDWPTWCRAEGFAYDRLDVEHDIVLTPAARILQLSTPGELDQFTTLHGLDRDEHDDWCWAIHWPAVAAEYDGIVIAPYQWTRRLSISTSWYYGWDCASGCIWNLDAIAELTVREQARA